MTHKETGTEERAPRKRVISLGWLVTAGLACLALLVCAIASARFAATQAVLAGVSVAGVELSGLERSQSAARLSERAKQLSSQKLRLVVGVKESSLTPDELGLTWDPIESAAQALRVGRQGGTLANAYRYLKSFGGREDLPAHVRVDAARLQVAFDRLETSSIEDPPFAGGLSFEGSQIRVAPARSGRRIARRAAEMALMTALGDARIAAPIVLPTEVVTPHLAAGELERARDLARRVLNGHVALQADARRLEWAPDDLAGLLTVRAEDDKLVLAIDSTRLETWLAPRRAALEAPARDAAFEISARDEIKVIPSEAGVHIVTDEIAAALWQAAQSEARNALLPLRREPLPGRSTEQAQQLGIRHLVGSFTTRHPCCQKRVENIHRIATLLDGLIVEPGQTVSVNAIVGPRTQKNGFVLAPGIEDGEMVDTMGGGVSQFATTFFNALFHAGYDIIERQPHSYWFPRYPMGHEATLSWPKPDIVFKNDTRAGLLIKTSFTDRTITVKLYGDTGGRKVSSSVSERRDIIKPSVELLPNRDIEPDEEKVKDGGMIGWSVIASRTVTFPDGTKKEEKRKVTYKPKARRVEVHPCRIPKGEPGATGEPCPEPADADEAEEQGAPTQSG